MRFGLAIGVLAVVVLQSAGARGDEHGSEADDHHAEHHGHPDYAIAILGVYAAGLPQGEDVIHHGGAGLAFHTGLIPKWLELEIALKAVFSAEHYHFPLEVALKIPFHLAESLFLSVGLGPVVALHVHGDELGVAYGGGVGAELAYWYCSWGGIVLGTAYELLYHEVLINKVVVVAGPAFGW
jgi:hypothetical protein